MSNRSNETSKRFEISPGTKVAHIRLRVCNMQRSLNFYSRLLGFNLIRKTSDENVLLSAYGIDNYLIHLSKVSNEHRIIEGEQSAARRAGLFHFAILLPSRNHLANVFKHLSDNSNQVCFEGAADHLVSESLYLRDPDSNGIEIYRDRDQSEWERTGPFQVKMSTEHLDLDQLYSEADDNVGQWRMPDKTIIGHVHLHVSNLNKSKKFYSEVLGLHHTCTYPGANFFAADLYHHHVATNTWLGTNIFKSDSRQPGLDHFALRVDGKENFERLVEQLQNMNIKEERDESNIINKHSIFIHDPDRIKIQIYY
jgi:catechol 2,3-dioxygenase